MANKNCVVVGGGLCGLFASILLADNFENVYVIEKDSQCGGLLKSFKDERGIFFDIGTHLPNPTQVPEIDNILFGPKKEIQENWTELGYLSQGNYFSGKWNLENGTPDARCLPKEIYDKGILELLSRTEISNAENILSYLTETIGPTFTNAIAGPVVKKLYDVDPASLTTDSSVSYFGLSRLIALSPEVTNKLKELCVFDAKLGFHTKKDYHERMVMDGIAPPVFYYPKRNVGVYYWIQHLLHVASEKNIHILNNESVEKIEHDGNNVRSVMLSNCEESMDCDFLLWSIPPVIALRAANIPVPETNLQFKTANIHHFSYDIPLLNQESHYLWNWDSNFKGFRMTLYPNLQPELQPSLNNITIESMSRTEEETNKITFELMHDELVRMGLVSERAKILSQSKQIIHNTFPVPTFEFRDAVKHNCNQLYDAFDNIFMAGRFSGKNWFQNDVIREVYDEVNSRFS